ncbi:hypothetical protein TNCV_3569721 [Trichonephila clavipes]|nr:hypothetical protein TNCV_3569721 [Trichonephila clavipes]
MEYVEIRNPTSRAQLLKMIMKYEDRYLKRDSKVQVGKDVRRRFPDNRRNRNWRDAEVLDQQNDRGIIIEVHMVIVLIDRKGRCGLIPFKINRRRMVEFSD